MTSEGFGRHRVSLVRIRHLANRLLVFAVTQLVIARRPSTQGLRVPDRPRPSFRPHESENRPH
jgi:hypothetical protein